MICCLPFTSFLSMQNNASDFSRCFMASTKNFGGSSRGVLGLQQKIYDVISYYCVADIILGLMANHIILILTQSTGR